MEEILELRTSPLLQVMEHLESDHKSLFNRLILSNRLKVMMSIFKKLMTDHVILHKKTFLMTILISLKR